MLTTILELKYGMCYYVAYGVLLWLIILNIVKEQCNPMWYSHMLKMTAVS